jgi:hypothetical protein
MAAAQIHEKFKVASDAGAVFEDLLSPCAPADRIARSPAGEGQPSEPRP